MDDNPDETGLRNKRPKERLLLSLIKRFLSKHQKALTINIYCCVFLFCGGIE